MGSDHALCNRRPTVCVANHDPKAATRWPDLGMLLAAAAILAASGPTAHAESAEYRFREVRTMRGPCCSDWGSDLVVDQQGSVLVAGRRGSLDLDYDGVIDIPTRGSPDPLISKFVFAGDGAPGWTKDLGSRGDDSARGVASDLHGGLYAVGHFSDEMVIASSALRSEGGKDGFIVRYDRDGEPLWARAIGGRGLDEMYRVATDTKGRAILIGTVTGEVDIDRDGTVDVVGAPKGSALVAAYMPDGELAWARVSGGDARVLGLGIATGSNDEIYIAGAYMDGAPDFDADGKPDGPVAVSGTSKGPDGTVQYDLNAYYAQLDADGRVKWIRSVSGPSIQTAGGLAVADNGDLFVLGGHSAASDLDGDGIADIQFDSMGDRRYEHDIDANLFLLRVDPRGKWLWQQTYSASGTHLAAQGSRILVSGTYANDLDFDNDGILERESDGDDRKEGFLAILDERGELQQLLTVAGDAADVVNAAGLSRDGKTLYTTGYTQLGADFDEDGKVEASSVCHLAGEVYLARYELEEAP